MARQEGKANRKNIQRGVEETENVHIIFLCFSLVYEAVRDQYLRMDKGTIEFI